MTPALEVFRRAMGRMRHWHRAFIKRCVDAGVPARRFGYRYVRSATPRELHDSQSGDVLKFEPIHAENVARNPLPVNIPNRDQLPAERGWWHYSFHDVPSRTSTPTSTWTLADCRVVTYLRPDNGDFWVGILTGQDRALSLREFHFRETHRQALLSSPRPLKLERATWLLERVYNNYSHWLTAHLPKFLLMKERGELSDVLLPAQRPRFVDDSLRMYGIEPASMRTFDVGTTVEVEELTLVESDRFRPELLRMPREHLASGDRQPTRRVFISREHAPRRRLLNEDVIWPLFERDGFERVFTERMSFAEQVRLMQETAVLAAPHGAGLTNMMFCREGTHVIEIADLTFPNPNFYATAAALGHHYWLIEAEGVGDVHPLEKDLRVEPSAVEAVLARVEATVAR